MHASNQDNTVAGLVLGPGVAVPLDRLRFAFSSSSGPGGQNVNKRATKCQLRVRVEDLGLTVEQSARLIAQAGSLLTAEHELLIVSDAHRSQERNKAETIDRLRELVLRALIRPKRRVATKPTRGSRERRISDKKARGQVKRMRSEQGD